MSSPEPSISSSADLPVHLTRFVGRERELDDLARLVTTTRLLTLTGAGGSGKTRLARETAAHAPDSFARVAWIDLASLADAEQIPQQIASTLRVSERAGVAMLELLAGAIHDDATLLVLDNCEHLVEGCAVIAEALLRACPRLTIIATSREALGIASETAWLVPPLVSSEAVQLFVERAQAALPSFARTSANAGAIDEICRRLDGIPLAIELAAARVRVLSPEQIAERLGDAFRLLTGGSRTALPRHRTLRATMEWSFSLLGTREQVLLRRLAVFAASFTLDAAEAVCAGDPLEAEDILDGVSALVDRSLVVMEPGDGVARYRLLETVRQYGVERLAEAGELERLEARFAGYLLDFVEAAAPNLVGGSNTLAVFTRLAAEQENLRAAYTWATANRARAETGLRFVGALFWYWYGLGLFREARQVVDRVLALDPSPRPDLYGRALTTSAITALAQGEHALARAHFEIAIPLLRECGDTTTLGTALAKYGSTQLLSGDVAGAVATLDDLLVSCRALPPSDVNAVFARFWRAWAAHARGEFELGLALITENERVGREFDQPTTLGHSLATQAILLLAVGDVERSCAVAAEALEIEVAIGDGWGMALAVEVIALIAGERGHDVDAVRLLGGLDGHRERLAVALPGVAPGKRAALVARLRDALRARFDEIHAEAHTMPTDALVALAFAEASRNTTEHRVVHAPAIVRADAGAQPRLRVSALGPLQVQVGDRVVEPSAWGSARPRELLVFLLMHPEGRTKEQAGLAFWPDASPSQLRNSFHVTLHRLRKALGGTQWVTLAGEHYRVDPALLEEFDAHAFERDVTAARRALQRQQDGAIEQLEQALARYRGDLLDGEPVGDWYLEHRDALQRMYVESLMTLGRHHAREERHSKAADVFRRVLARDELHEDALVALMRSLADGGERAQALRAYRRYADRLRAELEAEPGLEATRLFERLQTTIG